jgi:hypothetical protein
LRAINNKIRSKESGKMEVKMEVIKNDDTSEGHIFKEGDKLKIENENAEMTIKKRVIQIKDGKRHRGYWVNVRKLDNSFDGIRTVHEDWIKELPLIN